jgi:hypothetical protein
MAARAETTYSLERIRNLTPPEETEIWNSIYAGLSVKQTAVKLGFTFQALESWFYDPVRLPLLNRARQSLASQLAHQTILIADGPHCVPGEANGRETANPAQAEIFPDAARDKLRIQARQWLASKWDKDTYASSPSTVINVDAKSLHIDSLRKSSNDLQAAGRLNAAHNLPPVQLVDNTASLNAMPAAIDPPASPLRPAPWRGGTSSRDEEAERNTVVSSGGEGVREKVGTTLIGSSTTEGTTGPRAVSAVGSETEPEDLTVLEGLA